MANSPTSRQIYFVTVALILVLLAYSSYEPDKVQVLSPSPQSKEATLRMRVSDNVQGNFLCNNSTLIGEHCSVNKDLSKLETNLAVKPLEKDQDTASKLSMTVRIATTSKNVKPTKTKETRSQEHLTNAPRSSAYKPAPTTDVPRTNSTLDAPRRPTNLTDSHTFAHPTHAFRPKGQEQTTTEKMISTDLDSDLDSPKVNSPEKNNITERINIRNKVPSSAETKNSEQGSSQKKEFEQLDSQDSNTEDESCLNATLAPEGTFPLIGLISYPGSGNTWTRFLIERATGFYTGSRYTDKALFLGGLYGEMQNYTNGRTIVVKSHQFPFEKDKYVAVVFVIRNPYDAILAEFNRNYGTKFDKSKSHLSHAPDQVFKQENWSKFVTGGTRNWLQTIIKVITEYPKLLVVFYEELKTDLVKNLRRIVQYLGQPVNEDRLKCTKNHNDGNFHRKKHELPFDPYTRVMKQKINQNIKNARQLLKQHKRRDLPKYEKSLDER